VIFESWLEKIIIGRYTIRLSIFALPLFLIVPAAVNDRSYRSLFLGFYPVILPIGGDSDGALFVGPVHLRADLL